MPRIEPYHVAICQAERIHPRFGGAAKFKENVRKNIDRYCDLIDTCCDGNGPIAKLVTFGEFTFTGSYAPAAGPDQTSSSREIIETVAIRIPGPETDALAAKAKQYGVYIAAANLEYDPDYPDTHFNTAFIINPEGKIILKFPKLMGQACSVHDVMDKWVNPITKRFDPFPVVETRLGRLAVGICADAVSSPEMVRVSALKGAEVFLHLTDGNSGGQVLQALHQARAFDNKMYYVNSNWGPKLGGKTPRGMNAGYSRIIDFQGRVLAAAQDANETIVRAMIDIEALRKYRKNFHDFSLARIRTEMFAPYYTKTIYPPNVFLEGEPFIKRLKLSLRTERQMEVEARAIANLKKLEDFYREEDV